MQRSWRGDHDKLTFIACVPLDRGMEDKRGKAVVVGRDDAPDRMLGDVNLFLSQADEDEEGCIGELELMIAPKDTRRKGYGRGEFLIPIQSLSSRWPFECVKAGVDVTDSY